MATPAIEEALITLMKATSALTDEVGQRIYTSEAPPQATYPLAVVNVVADVHVNNFIAATGVKDVMFKVEVEASNTLNSVTVRDIVANLFNRIAKQVVTVSVGRTIKILSAVVTDSQTDNLKPLYGDDRGIKKSSVDVVMTYSTN